MLRFAFRKDEFFRPHPMERRRRCVHVADGVSRLLATYDMFIAPKAKG